VVPVPAGATTGNVVVTVGGVASNGAPFTVQLPDLIVTGFSWAPSNSVAGSVVTFSGTVKNQGTAATPAGVCVALTFWVDNNNAMYGTIGGSCAQSLAAGASASITATSLTWTATAGTHTILAMVDDANRIQESNKNNNTLTQTMTVGPAPNIGSLSPTSGAVGASVTITGANFGDMQGTSTVTFNGTAATPTSWSATSIVVPVPAGATTGNVVVTVAGVASNGVVFTIPPPNILGFSLGQPVQCPASSCVASLSGPPLMGFVINGTNFGAAQGASTATFNGTALPVVANGWTATSITVQVPAAAVIGTNGNVKVTVGNQDSNQMPFAVTKALTCPQQP
jgi:hypothetical protein